MIYLDLYVLNYPNNSVIELLSNSSSKRLSSSFEPEIIKNNFFILMSKDGFGILEYLQLFSFISERPFMFTKFFCKYKKLLLNY